MSDNDLDYERIKLFNNLIKPLTLRETVQLRDTLEDKDNDNFDKISNVNIKIELIESLAKDKYEVENVRSIL